MATRKIDSLRLCRECLEKRKSFVLQGGAGSGKTESVKDLLLYLSATNPTARVICITHTNNAVYEIQERIGDRYPVCTIHAFLHNLIKKYKKNIYSVISALYTIPLMERIERESDEDEKEYNKSEHERYKKVYGKYADKLYSLKKETCEKAVGKRVYDKDPEKYNGILNGQIESLNEYIGDIVESKDYTKIKYNETKFNSLSDLTYGHDGLLTIAHLLFEKYSVLGKILKDKYDYIFIDEYQDTKLEIAQDFLKLTKEDDDNHKLTLCLFGDSMQAIYSDGIGDVEPYADTNLTIIPKLDNYRCSYEVIDIINNLRLDSIEQKVALARLPDGKMQLEKDRHGDAKVFYALCDHRPTSSSTLEQKEVYSTKIDLLISEAKKDCKEAKILMLTNKAIAEKEGFKKLFKVFDDRYVEVNERMQEYLTRIQISDICEICNYYKEKNYNPIIKKIQEGGYVIRSIDDKIKLQSIIEILFSDTKLSIYEAYQYAITNKLIRQTETCMNIFNSNDNFIQELSKDYKYQEFKKLFKKGLNTFNRMKDSFQMVSEEEFHYYDSLRKKETFINTLFSDDIKFSDALNYISYLNEESEYITMHKTKGSSIDAVIVVMEEFFWNEYDFKTLYNKKLANEKVEKWKSSQKLIYVACSRARRSLRCVRLLLESEVEDFKSMFPKAEKIILPCSCGE